MITPEERSAWRTFLGQKGDYPLIGLTTATVALIGVILIMDILRPAGPVLTPPLLVRISPVLIPFILIEFLHSLCLRFMKFRLSQLQADKLPAMTWWNEHRKILMDYRNIYGHDLTATTMRWYPLFSLLSGALVFCWFVKLSG